MKRRYWIIGTPLFFVLLFMGYAPAALTAAPPFAPGEKLQYELRWENIPAGSACLEILPLKTINGEQAYHFVLTAESNSIIDLFFKVRDRVEGFADVDMTRSVRYQKKQREGRHHRDEIVEFDWPNSRAHYSNFGKKNAPLVLMDGSFDPLSAFYFTRTMNFEVGRRVERPITDGKKNGLGRLHITGRELVTLSNGKTYDAYRVEPELNQIGGVFQTSRNAKIILWVTADAKRIPVRIQSEVVIGHFIGELVEAQGVH